MAVYLNLAGLLGIPSKDALLLLTPGQLFEAADRRAQAKGQKGSDEL